jgi:hypothetical protein
MEAFLIIFLCAILYGGGPFLWTALLILVGLLVSRAGLPDGIFSNKKILIWINFGGPWNEKKLLYSMAIWNILRPFGIFYGHLVI